MKLTEEEAREKICKWNHLISQIAHHTIVYNIIETTKISNDKLKSINEGLKELKQSTKSLLVGRNCITSDCMWWEFIQVKDGTHEKGYEYLDKMINSNKGYCGLTK